MVGGQDGKYSQNAVFRVVEESEYELGHVQTHPLAVAANSAQEYRPRVKLVTQNHVRVIKKPTIFDFNKIPQFNRYAL